MRREKTSVSQEDYLKAIWEMEQEDQTPISARLAEELRVTPPAVTAALKRMARDKYLHVERDGRISLMQKGRQVAERLALRHQLAEKLLTEVIGLSWVKAHEQAERLEHAISPEVEKLLVARFGREARCPHGVPLMGGIAKLRRRGAVALADLAAGQSARVLCVYEKDSKFLEFVDRLSLRPGVHLRVERREYDETMTLRAAGRRIHLGKPATSRIWVQRAR